MCLWILQPVVSLARQVVIWSRSAILGLLVRAAAGVHSSGLRLGAVGVNLDRHVALAATLGAEEEEETDSSRNGNQGDNGSDCGSVGVVAFNGLACGALEADLDTELGFATGLQPPDVFGFEQATEGSAKATSRRTERQDGDTVHLNVARVGGGEEFTQDLRPDVTDATGEAVQGSQGVDRRGFNWALFLCRSHQCHDKEEDVLHINVLNRDRVVDLDAYLEGGPLRERGGGTNQTIGAITDVGLHGVVKNGILIVGVGKRPVGHDTGKSKVGRQVDVDGQVGLVKVDRLDDRLWVLVVVVVDADATENGGVGAVEGLVVVGAVDGRLNHVDVDIELVACDGFGKGNASYIGQSGAVGLVEGGREVLDVSRQGPCEVVLEDGFAGFGAVAKGNDRVPVLGLDVPVKVPGEVTRQGRLCWFEGEGEGGGRCGDHDG